ncbi:unnamed protein product [Adineta ricciae]|uniref:Uncharacterized protein n=1 Tax=Adineta ricciae TaxID=249248 RepID=A0A814ASD1_ADIRI|nr:unnamed protein product [Adineta ricciae]
MVPKSIRKHSFITNHIFLFSTINLVLPSIDSLTMMKSIPSSFALLISCLIIYIHANADELHQPHWLNGAHHNRYQLFKKWLERKPVDERAAASPYDVLHPTHQFKEPFQCPRSEKCIALQSICDGVPGDCPGNLDENEETCIAAKRPAKENIEKFLQAEYTLHGSKLFTFIFGHKISKSIEGNSAYWFDSLASAFSIAKTIRNFAEKTHMSSDELAHFQNVIQMIHDGRLEEIPVYAQEAVNQGLASLVEKLYESGFMDQ